MRRDGVPGAGEAARSAIPGQIDRRQQTTADGRFCERSFEFGAFQRHPRLWNIAAGSHTILARLSIPDSHHQICRK